MDTFNEDDRNRVTSLVGKFTDDTTHDELTALYAEWSKCYDKDTAAYYAYVTPKTAANVLVEKLKQLNFTNEAHVIDMGCGTGLVGEALHHLDYTNVDAIDISQELLAIAKDKGVYKNTICGIMGSKESKQLGVKACGYDAAICVGVFTNGHVRSDGFDDLVYAVKKGGIVVFTVLQLLFDNPKYGYKEKIEELVRDKKWKLISKQHDDYRATKNEGAWLYVFQIL